MAADHAGYGLKCELISLLRAREHQVDDLGTHGLEPVDYPDWPVAWAGRSWTAPPSGAC